MVRMRSSLSMKDDRALSVVVFARTRTARDDDVEAGGHGGLQICRHFLGEGAEVLTRSSIASFSFLNFRIETSEPSTATGGTMALKREPSARRAST